MSIIATCPKDKGHKIFSVTAHVTQGWIVNQNGQFIKTSCECEEVTHKPDKDDVWVCSTCGTEAVVKEE